MEDKFNDNNLSDETLSDDADYSANERHDDGSSTEKKDLLSHSDDLLDNHNHKNVNYHVSADSHYLEDNKNKVKNAAFVSEKPEKNKMDKGLKVFLITSAVIFGSLFLIFGASILANFFKKPIPGLTQFYQTQIAKIVLQLFTQRIFLKRTMQKLLSRFIRKLRLQLLVWLLIILPQGWFLLQPAKVVES